MPACKRKPAEVVIEICILPIGRVMAGGTVAPILAVMLIVLLVAGIAICRGANENLIDMAGFAGRLRMLAFQLESRQVVVELRRRPALDRMAVLAYRSQPALVRLHLGMTGKTIRQYNYKGIFTINQLSYTFHPRRKSKRAKARGRPHSYPLQAMAIRM